MDIRKAKKGMRVEWTREGHRHLGRSGIRGCTGDFVGFDRKGYPRILVDGTKHPSSFAKEFWKFIQPTPPEGAS